MFDLADGRGIGRIRLRHIPNASAATLIPFIEDSIEPGSTVHTHSWYGYLPLRMAAYQHRISNQKGHLERASELLPRVHQVFSLLKHWLLGTHQGSVAGEHLQDYLNEFAFRFNRHKSRSRGKLFYRLMQQAVAIEPTTYRQIVDSASNRNSPTTTCLGEPESNGCPVGEITRRLITILLWQIKTKTHRVSVHSLPIREDR